ncbi:MAG: hypothetical protein ACLP00_01580, partial [Terracidiphilus sp.]
APDGLKAILEAFAQWSLGRRTTWSMVIAQVDAISALWRWCVARDVTSLQSINQFIIKWYFRTTFWELRCSKCSTTFPMGSDPANDPVSCSSCGHRGPLAKVPKKNPNTIRGVRASLVVFFDWACRARLIPANPVLIELPSPKRQIQHCSVDELESLYVFVMDRNNDPAEALALYLTISHVFAAWELQEVKLPPGDRDLAEVYGLTAPRRRVSLGRHSGGRALADVSFLESARPWLTDLLRRFQAQRSRVLRGKKNDYLFVAPGTNHNNVHVSLAFISSLVQRASKQALGYDTPQKLLRKTGALVVAVNAGPEYLKQLGYSEHQAVEFLEADRELIGAPKSRPLGARREHGIITLPKSPSSISASRQPAGKKMVVRKSRVA